MKTIADIAREAKHEEDRMLALRRRIWRGEDVSTREKIELGMCTLDYLCKLSARVQRERDRETIEWLQEARRSLRAQLREYWTDALDGRRDIRAGKPPLVATS